MARQGNSSENNISSALKKISLQATIARLRYLFVHYKALLFITALIVSYMFMEIAVLSIMMDYLTYAMEVQNQRIYAIVTIQDALSSLFFVAVSQSSYVDCFTRITFCAAASIEVVDIYLGLLLLWTSTSPSASRAVYAAIVFLAIGKSGQKLSENFLEYQLKEKIKPKESEQEDGSTQNKKDRNLRHTILINVWLFVVGYITTASLVSIFNNAKFDDLFRFAALLMGATHLLFLFGSLWYNREELVVESDLKKIHRIFNAALRKRHSKYPTSPNCYYWEGHKQQHMYEHGEGLRLLPRVPRLFRWLDKAAIVKAEEGYSRDHEVSLETQEKKEKLCTVKEVREVKSLVHMIYLALTIFPYSLLMASGNTFFVSQASVLTPVMTQNGNDISFLFLYKAGAINMSRFTCFLISFAFRYMTKSRGVNFMFQRKAATIIRIGFGIGCAVICCFIAWQVEVRRLSSKIKKTTQALVPQFVLLGMTEALVDGGWPDYLYQS